MSYERTASLLQFFLAAQNSSNVVTSGRVAAVNQKYADYVTQSGSCIDTSVVVTEEWTSQEITNGTAKTLTYSVSGEMTPNWSLPSDGSFFEELYLHPHWLRYSDVVSGAPDGFLYFLGVYMIAVSITGIFGNITVIAVFLRTATLRTPSNYFIINLAFSDFTFSLINGFPLMSIACFKRKWMWGQTACEWYGFIGGVLGLNSIGSLAMIAIDRYISISRPFEMLYKASPKRSIFTILFIWCWALVWTCPPMFGWGRYIAEGFQVSCSFDYLTRSLANIVYNYCLLGFGFILPVAIISGCYVSIVRHVSRQSKEIMSNTEPVYVNRSWNNQRQTQYQARQNQEIRRAKRAAIMILLFILSWLPYALIAQFGIIGFDGLVTPYSTEIPVMFAKASAIWNPIVYAFTNQRYKVALQNTCPCCKSLLRSGEFTDSWSKSDGRSSLVRRPLQQSKEATSLNIEIVTVEIA